jgi:hypothetical protein
MKFTLLALLAMQVACLNSVYAIQNEDGEFDDEPAPQVTPTVSQQQTSLNAAISAAIQDGSITQEQAESSEAAKQMVVYRENYDDNDDSSEMPSLLPDWDFYFTTGGNYNESDYSVNASGLNYKSNTTSLWFSTYMAKDRLSLKTKMTYKSTKGKDAFSGSDSDYYALRLAPTYRLLDEDTQLINLDISANLELGYLNSNQSGKQWRLSPGASISASKLTSFGMFYGGYSFLNSRNIDGDTEATGESFINIHGLSTGYAIALSEKLYTGFGMQYTIIDDMPTDMTDEFMTLVGVVQCKLSENAYLGFNYNQDVEGSNNRGFGVNVSINW